jgi:hypothetical protein
MAKKSRRARKKAKSRVTPSTSQAAAQPRAATREPSVEPLPKQSQLQSLTDAQEYRYVVDDLRRVIILAAAMFALLIALSFFIR